jgi:NAD(P)-dependent dehydrogenase (short-subunit alcohol dehydrogenase family)
VTRLAGAVAVVTGGGSGIGFGIARAMRTAGAEVVLAEYDIERGSAAAADIGAAFVRTDVADAQSVAQLRDDVVSLHGRVDILVNNAGIGPEARLADMTSADWKWLIDVNLWGVINGVSTFLPGLLAQGSGHLVNVSSMSAFAPMSPLGGYAVTKAGVSALTEVLQQELIGTGVAATLVTPGPTRTDIGHSLRHRAGESGALREFRNAAPDDLFLTADQVGQRVVEGILIDEPLVITHPPLWPRVAERHDRIRTAFTGRGGPDATR